MAGCPDEEAWLLFLTRDPAAPRGLDAHLASCDDCRALLLALSDEAFVTSTVAESDAGSARSRGVEDSRLGSVVASKWRVEAVLGSGGMGRVYRARHRNGHAVAIKFLHPALASRPEVVRRFRREGYAANRVGHPAVVKVLDDGEDNGPFLVMELLEGRSCRRRVEEDGVLAPDEALRIVDVAGRALGVAHAASVIHRDVKPDNVFLGPAGEVRLLDFGLASARTIGGADSLTVDGVTMGTVGYMAPEQARGENAEVDARSDVWSLAATFVALVTGRTVHGGRTAAEQLAFAVTRQAPPVRTLGLGVPVAIEEVLDRALSFDRSLRQPDALAFVEELAAARAVAPRSRRGPAALAAILAMASLTAAFAFRHHAAASVDARAPASPVVAAATPASVEPAATTREPPPVKAAPSATAKPPPALPASRAVPRGKASAALPASVSPPVSDATAASAAVSASPPRDPLAPRF